MIHLVNKQIDYTSESTIGRDIRTLEEEVNNFTKDPSVTVTDYQFQSYVQGGDDYIVILVTYEIKRR